MRSHILTDKHNTEEIMKVYKNVQQRKQEDVPMSELKHIDLLQEGAWNTINQIETQKNVLFIVHVPNYSYIDSLPDIERQTLLANTVII